jgi:hypothetical protein
VVQTLSTMLTVVIAVGAIWAAFASTRQAQFSRRLASAAERNVGEQIRSFREQNERARLQEERAVLSFEVDMLFKLEDRINGQRLENTRRRAAKYLKDNFFTSDGGMLEVQHVHPDSLRILTFFEEVGNLRRVGVLQDEAVWYMFGRRIRTYWALYRRVIEKMREEEKDPTIMEEFEKLNSLMVDIDRQHGVGHEDITPQRLRQFVEDELASAGEESPTQA